jgi:hypothetical protein
MKIQPRSSRAHALIGVGAALTGVLLGFIVVYLGETTGAPTAAQTLAQRCQTNARAGQMNAPMVTDGQCNIECMGGPTGQGPKGKQNPKCICGQELGKADAGTTNCYNPGDCTPPGGLPACGSVEKPMLPMMGMMMPMMMMPMMGMGMPPMIPMIPMGMPKMMMPMPPQEECQKEPKPDHCKSGVSDSLLGSLTQNVKDFFSPGSAESGSQQSIGDKLQSFLTGGSSDTSNTSNTSAGTNNPTQAVVTPVVSGSNAGGLSAQGGTQSGNTSGSQGQNVNAAVTGFGGGSANVDTSTGPILSAIKSVTSRIQSILSSWF